MVSKDKNWRKLHNKGDPHIYAHLRKRINIIIKHQLGRANMLDYWFGECQKKEMILDAIRDCVTSTDGAEKKIQHINKLVNEFIFKGITMRNYGNDRKKENKFLEKMEYDQMFPV